MNSSRKRPGAIFTGYSRYFESNTKFVILALFGSGSAGLGIAGVDLRVRPSKVLLGLVQFGPAL